jgi:hypothetical protein
VLLLLPLLPLPQAPLLVRLKPALFAKCLSLLHDIAAAPLTCEPVFRLLQPGEAGGELLPGLSALLLEPLPPDGVHAQVGAVTCAHTRTHARMHAYVSLHRHDYCRPLHHAAATTTPCTEKATLQASAC